MNVDKISIRGQKYPYYSICIRYNGIQWNHRMSQEEIRFPAKSALYMIFLKISKEYEF